MKRLQPRGSFAKEEVMRERLRWLIDALISRCGVILQGFSHSVQLVPPLQPNISPLCPALLHPPPSTAVMSLLFLDWFVPLYLLVSVLVLAGFGACLYFLEPGLQDAHKWSSKTVRHHPLVASVNCRDDDSNALI